MQSKLIVSALVATSLLGAPVIAFAQNEAEPPAPMGGKAPATHHKMKSSHMKAGTTTGMSSSASRARPLASPRPHTRMWLERFPIRER